MQDDEIATTDIRECNALINYFIGNGLRMSTPYHKDWNELIRACHTWDNLDVSLVSDKEMYVIHSETLSIFIGGYDKERAYNRLIDALIWYFNG